MSIARNKYLETLKREFEVKRARVWEDESIAPDKKQLEVVRLWREFDSQRRTIQEGVFQGNSGEGLSGRGRGRPRFRGYGTTHDIPSQAPPPVEVKGVTKSGRVKRRSTNERGI